MFRKLYKNRNGSAIIVAYFAIVSLFIFVGAMTHRAVSSLTLAQVNMAQTEALYLSEAGVESVTYNLAHAIANYLSEPVTITPTSLATLAFPPSNGFIPPEFNLLYTCEAITSEQSLTDPSGIVTFLRNYKINISAAHAQYTSGGQPLTVSISQIVARNKTYTFQHAVFYEDDLEILPGPDMTLSGRVHTNSDLYIGTHNTLTIDSEYLYSAGDIYNRRKDSSSSMNGDVSVKVKDLGTYALIYEPIDLAPLDSDRADWSTESQNRWNGTIKSSVHGVTSLATPAVASIQPDGFYATNANVKIENGAIRHGGALLVQGVDIPIGTIRTTTSFYNNREGKWVRMTEIDMQKLAGYDEGDPPGTPSFSNHMPDNGFLFATRNDVPGAQEPGIRLVNGGEINRSGGLTIVSNQPVYVQGDYNDTNKKPAAVICDAVNNPRHSWRGLFTKNTFSYKELF